MFKVNDKVTFKKQEPVQQPRYVSGHQDCDPAHPRSIPFRGDPFYDTKDRVFCQALTRNK